MTWTIKDTQKLDRNTLKGSFSLVIGPMVIEGFTYHIKNEKAWVNPPSKEYLDKESGEKKYYPMIKFPEKNRYWNFQKWAISQVEDLFSPQQAETGGPINEDDIPF